MVQHEERRSLQRRQNSGERGSAQGFSLATNVTGFDIKDDMKALYNLKPFQEINQNQEKGTR